MTVEAKIALFRALFRGREDVYAKRWEGGRGRSGYSPVCANEWIDGICAKSSAGRVAGRSACRDCHHRRFSPVTDDVIRAHLQGSHVVGVYPLLLDETCWFVAADFDGQGWSEDAAAFRDTCQAYGLPVAIERSRSGSGGHAWLFFAAPVPAGTARDLGCLLVTETMVHRRNLALSSYDRLFPSQNSLPRGGLGNLIALPLQRAARDAGNTVFLDDRLEAWPDQWSYLAGVARIQSEQACALVDAGRRRDAIMAVAAPGGPEGYEQAPWRKPPSGSLPKLTFTERLPAEAPAVLCQRLFIARDGLPDRLLGALRRLAAFENPEFHARQRMRLSTTRTPRVIACAQDLADHVALPRGCWAAAEQLLHEHGVELVVDDQRETGQELDVTFHGSLLPLQEDAARAMLAHDIGVLVAPPGMGKTVVGTYLVAARRRSTLVLVHRQPLLEQWAAQLARFLALDPAMIGRIAGGQWHPNGELDVAMVQSLRHRGAVRDLVAGYGQVILDEAHHAPAYSFERVLDEARARFLVGLTATPRRRDGLDPILHMQLGPARYTVGPRDKGCDVCDERHLVVRETRFAPEQGAEGWPIQRLYGALAADPERNALIAADVAEALAAGRSPIVLTERRDHVEALREALSDLAPNVLVLHGGMKSAERAAALERLATAPDDEPRLIIATGRYVGEGFDDRRLDTLFLALPIAWRGTIVQYAGRLHRSHPAKTSARIYDYVDSAVPVLARMFSKRLRGYRAIGYVAEEQHRGSGVQNAAHPSRQGALFPDDELARLEGSRPGQPALAAPRASASPLEAAAGPGAVPPRGGANAQLRPSELQALLDRATAHCRPGEEHRAIVRAVRRHLRLPFCTTILGVEATVVRLELNEAGDFVAVCKREASRLRVPILDLPLPPEKPEGAEWIEAFRRWVHSP